MASLPYTLFLLFAAITGPFFHCLADSIRKELRDKEANQENVLQLGRSSNRVDPSRVIQLSWRPRVFLYEGFLTDEECDHLTALVQGKKESLVGVGHDSGRVGEKRMLASSDSSLSINDNIVTRIEERISAWTFLPKENSQPLKIMHYGPEEAKGKLDYYGNKSLLTQSEHLMATVILYLSNVSRGGAIHFPDSDTKSKVWSDCTKTTEVLRPIKGNAILFFTVHLSASPDKTSSHSRCPVLEGDMWVATKLFHLRSIIGEKISSHPDPEGGECSDEDENCPRWAANGECQKNPVFMTGSPDYYGTCRKSCNVC